MHMYELPTHRMKSSYKIYMENFKGNLTWEPKRSCEDGIILANLTFRGLCLVIYSYNKSQRDALFLKFISSSTLHVSDRSTVHHQEYLNTIYTQ